MSNFHGATGLIGGAAGALDSIDGAGLVDGDGAVVIVEGTAYHYFLDADSGAGESSPDVISPDDNPGTKRWILAGLTAKNAVFSETVSGVTPTAGEHLATKGYVDLGVADIGAAVYNDADISVADASEQALTFNTERWDTDTIHDTGSNTSRLTCKTAGVYAMVGHFSFVTNAVNFRQGSIRLNGSTIIAINGFEAPATPYEPRISISTVYKLSVNDYVELIAYQDSGGALDVQGDAAYRNFSPEFRMQRIA